jgi:hypothetical protein
MEARKELPKFIFKLDLVQDKKEQEDIKKILRESFGQCALVIFTEDNFEMFQLEDTYKKII